MQKYNLAGYFSGVKLDIKEEHRLKVSENWVLRRILGPARAELVGVWKRLHNEKLSNSYSSSYMELE
jgi:hypothetical protein